MIKLNVQKLLNGVSTTAMRQAGLPTHREVLEALRSGFDKGEFHELLFELGISKNDIGGESPAEQMRECVMHMERNGRFQDLVTAIASKRPHLFDESKRPI